MAAMPIIGAAVGAVSSVSGILGKSSQARAQEAQIEAQRVGLRDQQLLNEHSITEQRRQIDAAANREQLLGLQAQTLGMVQNDMQATQQGISNVQSQIQTDQAAFLNSQRAAQKEAVANLASAETLKQLQAVSGKNVGNTQKIAAEASGIQANKLASGTGGASVTNDVLLERIMNALADGAIDTQSVFGGEMDDATKQLLYETVTAGLEKSLGDVAVAQSRSNEAAGGKLNEMQRRANATNINTQTARNTNARDFETASKRGNLNLQLASNKSQTSSQLAGLNAQSSAIQRPGFSDLLGAGANLGMSLYQSGIFSKGGGVSAPPGGGSAPYSIMSGGGYNMSPFSGGTASGLLSSAGGSAFGFSRGGL